jgi:hypothetical protein
MIRQVVPVVLGIVALSAGVLAQSQKFGGPVDVPEATTVKELHASPDKFVGKTIRVDGVITAVCQMEGCWVAVRDASGQNTDQTVRFQADHDGKVAFPITAKGKTGSFQGEFVKIAGDDHEAQSHAQAEGKTAAFATRYQIKLTGAVVADR